MQMDDAKLQELATTCTHCVLSSFVLDQESDGRRQMDEAMLQAIKVEVFPRSEISVLVRVTAPARKTHRIGVDVVAVLDVSWSMNGERLEELKKAMEVVINKLGKDDRLSIVSFETGVNRLTELTYMTDQGRDDAWATVQKLVAGGCTNMGAALQEGYQILSDRGAESISSPVGCMIFLSDGDDKEIYKESLSNVFPVYTFGLGADHNPKAPMMHIADETHGTYSFVSKDIKEITNAFALFMDGLTSVAATSVKITFKAHKGTTISAIECGPYLSDVAADNCSGVIKIPDMYAGEQKNFIVDLLVTGEGMENLMTVGGQYEIDGTNTELVSPEVTVRQRGGTPGEEMVKINPEVQLELTRVKLVRGISSMEKENTSDGLQELWDRIKGSVDARATLEEALSKLEDNVAEMKKRIDEDKSRLAYVLSWLSCHSWQRETTKNAPSDTDDADMPGTKTTKEPPSDTNDAHDADMRQTILYWHWLLLFLLWLLVVALLVMAVKRYFGGGLDIPAAMVNTPALELSGHPGWPAMEQDLRLIVHKTDDVQFTSYFRYALPEDMNLQMDRYLYLAIVHATILRRRSVASAIPDKLVVRREAESYLQNMLMRMKHVDTPSFQDTSAEFITYEMNRYLYSTIVQACVLRSIYRTPDSDNERVDSEQDKTHMVQISKLEEQLRQKEMQLVRMTELEELKAKQVTRIAELELELQYREKLVVRMEEVEQALQQETIVVSLRSELKQQQESCAQRAAKVQVKLKTCSQMAEKWKAMVLKMGGYIDDEDYYYEQRRTWLEC